MSYNTKRFKKKQKRIYCVKLVVFLVLVLVLFVGAVFAIRHPSLNIQEVDISDTRFTNREFVSTDIKEILMEKKFFFLPKSSFMFLPQSEITQNIKENNPAVSDISFDLIGINKIVVDIEEYEPRALWCKDKNNCLFVNGDGVAFMDEPFLHNYDGLVRFDGVDPATQVGWSVINRIFLEDMLNFIYSLKELNLEANSVSTPDKDVYYIEAQDGLEILVSSQDNLEDSFDNLKLIFEKNAIDAETLGAIDYIDLRFGNKVFYKLKGE